MGASRFTVSAMQRIAALRLYKGKLSYVPVAADAVRTKCTGAADCAACLAGLEPAPPANSTAADAWDRTAVPLVCRARIVAVWGCVVFSIVWRALVH